MTWDERTLRGRPMPPSSIASTGVVGVGLPRRAFLVSIEQARGMLHGARRSLAVLQALHDEVGALAEEMEHLLQGAPPEADEVQEVATMMASTIEEWQTEVTRMESTGTHVLSLDPGRLVWYGVVDAHVVAFGWQQGEPGIEWYHELDEGFDARKPLIEA
jgi:hypothetical protein